VPSNQSAGYKQTATMDYTGSCTIVELDEIPNASANGRLQVRLNMGTANYALFEVLAGTLYGLSNDGTTMNAGMGAWDLATARFLRIREQSGSWYWETSPDDTTYTQFGMTTQSIAGQTSADLELFVSTSAGVSNGGQVQIGGVRVLVRP
jgi:hypothetical protein